MRMLHLAITIHPDFYFFITALRILAICFNLIMRTKMAESNDNKYENKYIEVVLMISNFLIPLVGLQMALKDYLQEESLSFWYILLLMLVGGNVMTAMIFLLNDKTLIAKGIWTAVLLIVIVGVNFIVK
jgi:small-conductance mechanosensitive channel